MSTFLSHLAHDIYDRYNGNFINVTIIFPNKRAGLFLAEEFRRMINKPTWMPEVITLDEFISKHVGWKNVDETILLIYLYKAYCKQNQTAESFDEFYHWGKTLLGDFDDIDKYMVAADKLLANIVALKDIDEQFNFLKEEEIELIRQFWSCFQGKQFSIEQQRFLSIWESLYPTYIQFRDDLIKDGLCYSGMLQREFAEHLAEHKIEADLIFAGFNALNQCEKEIFSFYKKENDALFYWDYDHYYLDNPHNEAGHYLRTNIELLGSALEVRYFRDFEDSLKKVRVISVPSIIGQTKLIDSLLETKDIEEANKVAIVLCDEHLLIPTLNGIPKLFDKINVTMGYPARNSSIAGILNLLLNLQSSKKIEGNKVFYYHKPVKAILSHQIIQQLIPAKANEIIDKIERSNWVYIDALFLKGESILDSLFEVMGEKVVAYMLNAMKSMFTLFKHEEAKGVAFNVEREILFTIYKSIQATANLFEQHQIYPDDILYIEIITKMLDELSIPFEGEPVEGIQVMGLMESRMLDFEKVIILSANEGTLPKTSTSPSYIPFSLRSAFQMPTPQHQDALFAYYFYRLIQRAKDVNILYCSQTSAGGNSEKSRFLYQLAFESSLNIENLTIENFIDCSTIQPISILKSKEILDKMLSRWCTQNSAKGALSPSALNTYLECSLRFYFKYIANIEEPEELTEQLDHRLLGTVLHESCEEIFARFGKAEITIEQLEALIHNDGLIEQAIKKAYEKIFDQQMSRLLDSGVNSLILNAIKRYVKQILRFDKQQVPLHIESIERKYNTAITTSFGDIQIAGSIDRIDRNSHGVRVIDYKSGSDDTKFKDINSLFDSNIEKRNKAALQTMLYSLMYAKNHPEESTIVPGVYNTRSIVKKDYDYHLYREKDIVINFRHYEVEFEENLKKLIEELLDINIPFCQTEFEKKCKTCTYNKICTR